MIYIGSDHGGFALKQELLAFIRDELKMEIEDAGCFSTDSVDYPDIAATVTGKVLKDGGPGIVICGTGIGISIAANKVDGIRCALCTNEYMARMTRRHNDANVLALGGRVIGVELARSICEAFLTSDFDGGRHQRRVDKISSLEC
jgi:ribose 5-phosphate isomerase B